MKVYFLLIFQDLNIGIALWLAASGDGWVYDEISNSGNNDCQPVKYKSEARVLLVGSGADEQCAGYGRHRTKYRNGRFVISMSQLTFSAKTCQKIKIFSKKSKIKIASTLNYQTHLSLMNVICVHREYRSPFVKFMFLKLNSV